ncbi:MAG: hypothetical protein AAB595_00410 [Patescibacteria group bacterium]
MIIAILSILILTSISWVLGKISPIKICPICAGVFLTWLGMFFGMFLGKLSVVDYQLPTAILAGGTVVGLMSKLEQFIKIKFVLFWKTVFVISGFAAVYGLVASQWVMFFASVTIVFTITLIFKMGQLGRDSRESDRIKDLKKKMKNCC